MVVVPQSKPKVVVAHAPIQVSNFLDAMDKRYIPRLDFCPFKSTGKTLLRN